MSGQGDGFTDAGKAGMVEAVQWLRAKGGAGRRVNGHRDHHSTECPGSEIYAWLKTAEFDKPAPTPAPVQEDDMPLNDADKKWIADTIAAANEKNNVLNRNRYSDLRGLLVKILEAVTAGKA